MRIAHVIGTLDYRAGGPPAVCRRLAIAQARLGHEVTIMSPRIEGEQLDPAPDELSGADRVSRVLVDYPTVAPGRIFSRTFANAVEQEHPDIIHMHGVWEPLLLRASEGARRAGIPYVIRPAGMLDVWSMARSAMKKRIALALGFRTMLAEAGAIHALNEHEAKTVQALGFGSPVVQIPNGVFLEEVELATEPGEFRASVPGLANHPYALFLSRLHYKKGLDILADAWTNAAKRLPDHHLVVAGPREDDSVDSFLATIDGAGFSERVHLVGSVHGRRKSAAFREAACFVLPSRQEGFSVAITEALSLGVPAVVTDECHFPEVAEAGAGRVTTLEARDFADAMVELLQDEGRRLAAGEAGARLVRERFTWPAIAERTVELCLSVIGTSTAAQ
ncbi:MAG: glycosyltransferase [Phycisphaeraceae bacterium]|nr:MAG: glycosyltransferase [Phycisphaeraceae bacterium]